MSAGIPVGLFSAKNFFHKQLQGFENFDPVESGVKIQQVFRQRNETGSKSD